jgi:arylsulfatase A-like enzyme
LNRLTYLGLTAFVALAEAASGAYAKPVADSRPNFVVILAEAQGWASTSVAMDDRLPDARDPHAPTAAVARLAREGARFAQGYAASPRCTPSRAALLTGRSPAVLHMTYVGAGRRETMGTLLLPPTPILELPAREVTVAELLHATGYTTAHFGKWHLGRVSPAQHGFDASDGPTGNGGPDNVADPNPVQARGMTARGIAFIEAALQAGKPFYVQLSHYPNQGEKARQRGNAADAAVVDATVAELLAALDRLGVADRTYVIYTSDHGAPGRDANEPLSGGKGAVTEGGLRVPFLIRGPGVPAGLVVHTPVTAMDVLPTILELAHLEARRPAGVEGGSLVPLWQARASDHPQVVRAREELVFHFPHYDLGNGGPATALLAGNWKLVKNYDARTLRLYDLARDPAERRDLAATQAERVADLDARLVRYLAEVQAQLPQPNPNYDPAAARQEETPPPRRNGGGRGAKEGKGRSE